MNITSNDFPQLKPWLATKLEALSLDLDSDVLADYLAELLSSDGSEAEVKASTLTNLAEFLPDGAGRFVEQIWPGVRGRVWDPQAAAAAQKVVTASGRPGEQGPAAGGLSGGTGWAAGNGVGHTGSGQGKRKRQVEEEDETDMRRDVERYARGSLRGRGDRGGRKARRGKGYDASAQSFQPQNQLGFPGLDGSDPMAMLQAMQAAMVQLQQQMSLSGAPGQRTTRSRKRCRDFDNTGVCARGASCRYDHGQDLTEYPPRHASGRGSASGRARGASGGRRGKNSRASFSSTVPGSEGAQNAVVVENIPPEKMDETTVRTFFEDFGAVDSVELDEARNLAIVTFANHESAKQAFTSPRVVFDNRFVKVYWFQPQAKDWPNGSHGRGGAGTRGRAKGGMNGHENGLGRDANMEDVEEEQMDMEAFRQQQEAAQQRFEELQDAKRRRQELDAKLKAQMEEQAALMRKLASKTDGQNGRDNSKAANDVDVHGIGIATGTSNGTTNGFAESAQTAALKAKLAALEAEAKSIGLSTDTSTATNLESVAPGGRSQDGYYYSTRGHHYGFSRPFPPPRSGHRGRGRGRGMVRAALPGGAVRKLDNRPRGLAMTSKEGKGHEQVREGLLQYLVLSDQGDGVKVSTHPTEPEGVLIVFTERYKADIFLFAIQGLKFELPHVGRVDIRWATNAEVPAEAYPDDAPPPPQQNISGTWAKEAKGAADEIMQDLDGQERGEGNEDEHRGQEERTDSNHDVADDDDRWVAG